MESTWQQNEFPQHHVLSLRATKAITANKTQLNVTRQNVPREQFYLDVLSMNKHQTNPEQLGEIKFMSGCVRFFLRCASEGKHLSRGASPDFKQLHCFSGRIHKSIENLLHTKSTPQGPPLLVASYKLFCGFIHPRLTERRNGN